jgi:hypothetical protein
MGETRSNKKERENKVVIKLADYCPQSKAFGSFIYW